MASTTSTEQSGLFAHLLPAFKAASGIDVRVVAQGTGQALDSAAAATPTWSSCTTRWPKRSSSPRASASKRFAVMYNDFVLVGPKADPAGAKGSDIVGGLRKVAAAGAPFVSRGDKSGTHAAELRYWKMAGIDVDAAKPKGYQACGCGMGPALNIAASTNGYALADRGTWLNFKNRGELAILVEGDKRLFNQYGVIAVNPAKHPHVKAALAQQFVDWVLSPAGQASIAGYRIGGEQLFFPNAGIK